MSQEPIQQNESPAKSSSDSHPLQCSGFNSGPPANSQTPPPLDLGGSGTAQLQSEAPIQRQVRVNMGTDRVNEAAYQPGGDREGVGNRFSVASLISDAVKRTFRDQTELEAYANGQTDYIGDVHTQSGETYWYRQADNGLKVLGERHHNAAGNVEDVINGLQTSRFIYEPYHEFTDVGPFTAGQIGNGTNDQLRENEAGLATGPHVDRASFDPSMENIVIKAMTGTMLARNAYLTANPAGMTAAESQPFRGRPDEESYSMGDRIALYVSMAVHIAQDIAQYNFPEETGPENHYYVSGRRLQEFYLANQGPLDVLMTARDNSDTIGIYELTAPNNFAILPILQQFTAVFHEYGSRYIEQLGDRSGNDQLRAMGGQLVGSVDAGAGERDPVGAVLDTMNPAREEIMWQKVQEARAGGYIIAGMGDAHRRNFEARLDALGIPHEEVVASLTRQRGEVDAAWQD